MPKVSRSRVIGVDAEHVWDLISDPHNLPRWWPKAKRVEDVRGPTGARAHWTTVLETAQGRGVRADYRCLSSAEGERYVWEQELEGTPFAKHLRSSRVEIGLAERGGETEVSLSSEQQLRGMSRLGGALMRRGQGAILDEALDGIERAIA